MRINSNQIALLRNLQNKPEKNKVSPLEVLRQMASSFIESEKFKTPLIEIIENLDQLIQLSLGDSQEEQIAQNIFTSLQSIREAKANMGIDDDMMKTDVGVITSQVIEPFEKIEKTRSSDLTVINNLRGKISELENYPDNIKEVHYTALDSIGEWLLDENTQEYNAIKDTVEEALSSLLSNDLHQLIEVLQGITSIIEQTNAVPDSGFIQKIIGEHSRLKGSKPDQPIIVVLELARFLGNGPGQTQPACLTSDTVCGRLAKAIAKADLDCTRNPLKDAYYQQLNQINEWLYGEDPLAYNDLKELAEQALEYLINNHEEINSLQLHAFTVIKTKFGNCSDDNVQAQLSSLLPQSKAYHPNRPLAAIGYIAHFISDNPFRASSSKEK